MKKLKKIVAVIASALITASLPILHMSADEEYIISSDDSRYKYIQNADGSISIAESEYSRLGVKGNVTLPSVLDGKTVTGICKSGFSGCDLASVVVPESITDIGSLAFANCLTLSKVKLGDNITHMGELVFSNTGYETTLLTNSQKNYAIIDDYILYLYTGSQTEIEVPNGVRVIANSAFANNGYNSKNEITSVILPDGVEYIGDNVFENCNSLSEITIKTGLKSVGNNSISSKPVIKGFIGTYAEQFAAENGNKFIPLLEKGEYRTECDYDLNFKQYYFSTDTEFSREGLHVYKRFYDGIREEITDWTFNSTPNELYAKANN